MRTPARRPDTIVQDLGDETMVFDSVRGEYHLLNPLAALVFRHVNEGRAPDEIVAIARDHFGSELEAEDVDAALAELRRVHLLDAPDGERPSRPAISRRAAAGRLAALALSAPLVTSLLAPDPAMAASGGTPPASGGNTPPPSGPKPGYPVRPPTNRK